MKKRETELDILRFIALFAVVAIHTCGGTIRTLSPTNRVWEFVNSFEAAITWCVPIYVMISGRFFLDPSKDVTVSNIWGKTILRLLRIFIIWSIVYQCYYILNGEGLNWKGNLSQVLVGPYHFWYLHMLIWLYAVTPLLRKLTTDKKTIEYFLLLFLFFHFLSTYGGQLPLVGTTLQTIFTHTNFHFAMGYTGYYVLGYYLSKYSLDGKKEWLLYVIGIVMLIFTVSSVFIQTRAAGVNVFTNATYPMPNIILEAAALFLFFVKRVCKINFSDKCIIFFAKMTNYGFGVYIVHGLVVEFYGHLGLLPITNLPLILIPVCTTLVLITSIVIVYLLKRIPFIREYLF